MPVDYERLASKLAARRLLFACGMFGFLLLLFPHLRGYDSFTWINWLPISEVGMAFLVAAILGWVVDDALKRDLIRNAVATALGYLLPDSLKDELRWLYDQKFLTEQTFSVRLEHRAEERGAIFHGHYVRTIRNNSGEKAAPDIHGGADEWFHHSTSTRVTKCGITRNGAFEPIETYDNITGIGYDCNGTIELEPDQALQVEMAYTMFVPENGMEILTHNYPIDQPLVTLDIPDTLKARVIFSHRVKRSDVAPSPESGHFSRRLSGVLLPHTDIRIYWNPASEMDARAQTITRPA